VSDEAWAELRELAGGPATIDHPGASLYAMTHTDGWSRDHLYAVATARLIRTYWEARPE
jgi:hypothetical protein